MTLDALFLAAHPDDVELFCGASVALLAARGLELALVDLTAGEKASNGSAESRRASSLEAARTLGVETERAVLGLPDGGLSAEDPGQLDALMGFLRDHPSRYLFAPWTQDRHSDHVAAGQLASLAREALRRRSEGAFEALLFYPTHSDPPAHLYLDVTDQMPRWRAAIGHYADQFVRTKESVPTPINRPEFLPAQEERRREWGRLVGCAFAEPFALSDPGEARAAMKFLGARTA